MDRQTVYSGELPISTDFLLVQQNAMVALAKLTESLCGTAAFVTGLACTPTTPTASLSVNLAGGNIYQQVSLEATVWSGLGADTTDKIVKQGIALASQALSFTPPSTSGFSQMFLIEAQYQDSDTNPKVLPYFNPAVLTSPGSANFSGPGNSGASQATARKGILAVQIKAGAAASTGTETAPIADTGWVPLYIVTLANGQTQITSGSIAVATGAPFLTSTVNELPAFIQSAAALYAVDTGAANALVIAPNPAPAAIAAGMQLRVKVNHNNGTSTTLQVTLASGSTQTNAITRADGSALKPCDLLGGEVVDLSFDGSEWQIPAPAVGSGRTSVADANYTALGTDRVIAYTSLTAARAITLPAASAYPTDRILWIVDETGAATAAKSIAINRAGSDAIDNGTSTGIAGPYGVVGLTSNGSNAWTIVHTRINTALRTTVNDASYSALIGDRSICYTAVTAARTVSLLAAASYPAGTAVMIRDDFGQASSTKTISAAPNGSDTIQGYNSTAAIVKGAYSSATLETDGVSKWFITRISDARERLVANRTYFVSTTGSDSTGDGLTSGTAFATLQKAWDTVADTLDLNGFVVTILLGAGTYTTGLNTSKGLVGANGSGSVLIIGQAQTSSAVTVTIASPGVVTWNAHGFVAGQPLYLSTTGALPTGYSPFTTYFVVNPTTNTLQLAATSGGSAINTSGTQSGTHTATSTPNVIISTTSADAIGLGAFAYGNTAFTIGGIKLTTATAGNCYNASGAAAITIGTPSYPVEFGACAQSHIVGNHSGDWAIAGTNNIVSGNAIIHVAALSNCTVALHNTTETFLNSPAFTASYADVESAASLFIDGMTYVNVAAVTGPKFVKKTGGQLIAGATIPGSSAGIEIPDAPLTVATLPGAAGVQGLRKFVSDATVTTFASVVAGSGSNPVPVYSDGTNWRIG